MDEKIKIKEEFFVEKDRIFNNPDLQKKAYKFSLEFSMLVEDFIVRILNKKKINFVIASVGSFSRRELSPYSDIDIMFILDSVKGNEDDIRSIVTYLWDCGIEVSHTVRIFSDVKKFLKEDLHAFTPFFETRFLYGNRELYNKWNEHLFSHMNLKVKRDLVSEFKSDTKLRYKKYGDSPKVLEPNIKFSAGGLRDLHIVEWIYSLKHNILFTDQNEISQTEHFLNILEQDAVVDKREIARIRKSYKLLLNVRNLLHLLKKHKTDRFEFTDQETISELLGYGGAWHDFMKKYFKSANIINRFSKTMIIRFNEELSDPISDHFAIDLDEDFVIKGGALSIKENSNLTISEILRAFYYRGVNDARFDENLRSLIIFNAENSEDDYSAETESSVFFREILKLPQCVAKTLLVMNELGVLGAFLPEFRDLVGFFQPGVYHCYTADEHTLIALKHLEELNGEDSNLGNIYTGLKEKDIIHLAVLFHDIAKPLSVSGHEIIGAEVAASIMERLGYEEEEIHLVQFLVKNHLVMEQIAFRRNINDPSTLDNFISIFPSLKALNLLYLLTFADLSAVNNVVWTQWKNDQLYELYRKAKQMLVETLSGEELLFEKTREVIADAELRNDEDYMEHVESMNDIGYFHHFSEEEINQHIDRINKGDSISIFFKEEDPFTNITIITKDTPSLLSKLCGALSINDLNIHDARIFTRKDGIVIDSFNVTDFRTHKIADPGRYDQIKVYLTAAVHNELQINKEFSQLKSRWWRLENKLFRRRSKVKIRFEDHKKFTIIDVSSPDRLGLLYRITRKLADLDLSVYIAKIGTKGDDVIDSFYTLNRNGDKIEAHDYEMIKMELTETIKEML
ncbi:MAG: [protein-PII] uridylyltransferase [Melioribacteraceae bacterium]|nr:[protein-PII] uridylyltransferase [Melioribacteraceae bacterium]